VTRFRDTFPPECRPSDAEVNEFAWLFTSYLHTSLEFVQREVLEDPHGCHCSFCNSLISIKLLKPKKAQSSDGERARSLKLIYLQGLCNEIELPLVDDELLAFMGTDRETGRDVAICTYISQLFRREKFASQGGAVHALWKEIQHSRP